MHLGLVSLQSTWLDLVCALLVCALLVCALLVCALLVCALLVCALLVCALLVCALLVCVHDCASSHEPLPPSISIQDAAADGQ
jgi:hypothetical protein